LTVNYYISLPVFTNTLINNYNFSDFLNNAVKILESSFCLLCNKYHPAKIYCFLERYYLSDLKIKSKIIIFRIICYNNLNKNKKQGLKLKYTLTILPYFLAPYSLVPVNLILNSIQQFITNSNVTLREAAILMNCSSSLSFKLYYLRFKEYVKDWIMIIIQLLLSIDGECREERIKEISTDDNNTKQDWDNFKKYLDLYFNRLSKLPDFPVITCEQKYPYIHAQLCHKQMGLGP
jgi:hypothetical protein